MLQIEKDAQAIIRLVRDGTEEGHPGRLFLVGGGGEAGCAAGATTLWREP